MLLKYYITLTLFAAVIAKNEFRKNAEESGEEVNGEESYAGRNVNYDRLTTTLGPAKGEMVVEKFVETLMSSERYLRMMETVERKLNHLDATFHERTNTIIKYLSDMLRIVKNSAANELEDALKGVKNDLDKLKSSLTSRLDPMTNMRADTRDYYVDSKMDVRLSHLEDQMKNIGVGVDSIVSIISEVKSRQYSARTSSTSRSTDAIGSTEMATLINEFKRTLYEQKAKKCDCRTNTGRVDRSERYPTDCHEIQLQGFNVSGIYKIKPDEMEPFYVLCDLSTSGGEWTVFQNRFDGSQDFFRNWIDYKHGFGNLAGEFWLGLEKLHYLTNQKLYELRIEMESPRGLEAYAAYSVFTIGPEHEGYRISTLGTFHGNAGDSLSYHAGQKFSTVDVDNDEWKDGACTAEHGGAWWYKECDKSNLNGKYASTAEENRGQSIYWVSFKGPNFPLSKTKMMIRPLPASRPNDYTEQNRKLLDISKLNQLSDRMKYRSKDLLKGTYNLSHVYRYGGDYTRAEPFLPNYT